MDAKYSNGTLKANVVLALVFVFILFELGFAFSYALKVKESYNTAVYQQLRLWCQNAVLQHDFELARHCAVRAVEEAKQFHEDGLNEALAREDLGDVLLREGRFAESANELSEALTRFIKFNEAKGINTFKNNLARAHEVACYASLARCSLLLGKLEAAMGYCQKGLELSKSYQSDFNFEQAGRSKVTLWEGFGDISLRKGDYAAARLGYQRALGAASELVSLDDRIDVLKMKLANLAETIGDYKGARVILKDSQWFKCMKRGDNERIANPDQSERFYLQALEATRDESYKGLKWKVLEALCRANASQNKFESAEMYCRQAIDLRKALPASPKLAQLKGLLGEICLREGKFAEAKHIFESLAKESTNPSRRRYTNLRIFTDLGLACQGLKNRDAAVNYANEAFLDLRNVDNCVAAGVESLNKLALLNLMLGRKDEVQKSLAAAESTLQGCVTADDPRRSNLIDDIAKIKTVISKNSAELADVGRQKGWWIWNEDLFELTKLEQNRKLFQSAMDLYNQGEYEQTKTALDDLERVEKTNHAPLRARAKIATGEYDEAIKSLTEAIRLKPRKEKLYRLRARAYRDTQQYEKALADLDSAIKMKESTVNLDERAEIFDRIGQTDLARKDRERAAVLRATSN